MRSKIVLWISLGAAAALVVACGGSGSGSAPAAPPVFKQLAGPPSEMESMQAPTPASMAVHSTGALLSVTPVQNASGTWISRSEVPVDSQDLSLVVLSADGAASGAPVKVTLEDPATTTRKSQPAAIALKSMSRGLAAQDVLGDVYQASGLTPGRRQLVVESAVPARRMLRVDSQGPTELISHLAARNQRVGQRIRLLVRLHDRDAVADAPSGASITSATLHWTTPDGRVLKQVMLQEGALGAGVVSGDILADQTGNFNAQVVVEGTDTLGNAFLRTSEHLIPVVPDSLRLRSTKLAAKMVAQQRMTIGIDVLELAPNKHVRVFGEVWGTDAAGAAALVPVAWVAGMSVVSDGALSLGLDTRWIAKAGARAPFELRNVRIEDPDHSIELASAPVLPLSMPDLPAAGVTSASVVVDEEMRSGPRPVRNAAAVTAGVGHTLLLVHGYCSDNVWGPNVSRFSNASTDSVFLDLNANRSHDDFARRILEFGQKWNSYAIVAHSQGGAASLHLKAFYWSGLDEAGPGRLIQSVGTPYQGTALAGVLAAIGSVFGQGCGLNNSLTYDGSKTWLATIPPDARSKVHYYTTTYADHGFWTRDYCNLFTDTFLSDPNDGVVELKRAQLPGGVNQGNTTGQCHTATMRDPSQVNDAARNAIMNANAAVAPAAGGKP